MLRRASRLKHLAREVRRSSTAPEQPRINPVGIQYLSKHLDKQIFPNKDHNMQQSPDEKKLVKISQDYLEKHCLLGKSTAITTPISFDIPKLEGKNMDEHFRKIALFASDPYLDNAKKLAGEDLAPKPEKFLMKSGWYKYVQGQEPQRVECPDDKAFVFDVETLYKVSQYPVMATAASPTAWYGWVSPILTGESTSFDHLIPLNTLKDEKVIVGHNVGYDRARVKEEYDLKETKAFYLDTMALHIAVSGMCSQQRIRWMEHRKLKNSDEIPIDEVQESETNDPWVNYSSPNSLADVAQFYFKQEVNKGIRDTFGGEDVQVIKDQFYELMDYCANDVLTTHRIYTHVLPEFLINSPHPVSFAALRFMGSGILPTNNEWYEYINRAESIYQESRQKIEKSLVELAEEAVKLRDNPESFVNDPWLNQLDWTICPLKITKAGEPYKNQKLPGYPEWYRELHSTKESKLDITIRARITPLLLKLTWEDCPVVWHDLYGWCFKASANDFDYLKKKNYVYVPDFLDTTHLKYSERNKDKDNKSNVSEENAMDQVEQDLAYMNTENEVDTFMNGKEVIRENFVFFKVPNSIGPNHRTTLLLAKAFAGSFEKGLLKSDNPVAQEALKMNASCSYWISARERIMSQFVVPKTKNYSLILPQVVTMGTITRRAVEKTWLTASNAKKSRIGSELKSKVIAPKGYCFVGADVDSEELWIASLVGDSMLKMHGATAIGWMTLEGSKNEGTDLHSKTANILGISRNEAKIFNYGRIYGAGVKFATTLLKKFNPTLTDEECSERAKNLYAQTKGKSGVFRVNGKNNKIWFGGSESVLFNALERIAHQDHPKTPVLGASITKALMKKHLNANSFMPSRVNWAIQSSGVDYLHLLCVSMNFLIKKYGINERLSLSVHDEIRYLVKDVDKYRAAMALQISNIWTRAIFSENLGMCELPQSCAFFSAVDIDHILRKEVDMDCITPSNPNPVTPGESLDIKQLLAKPESELGKAKRLSPSLSRFDAEVEKNISNDAHSEDKELKFSNYKFSLENPFWKRTYIKMQTSQKIEDFRKIYRNYKKFGSDLEIVSQRVIGKDDGKINSVGDLFDQMELFYSSSDSSLDKMTKGALNSKKKSTAEWRADLKEIASTLNDSAIESLNPNRGIKKKKATTTKSKSNGQKSIQKKTDQSAPFLGSEFVDIPHTGPTSTEDEMPYQLIGNFDQDGFMRLNESKIVPTKKVNIPPPSRDYPFPNDEIVRTAHIKKSQLMNSERGVADFFSQQNGRVHKRQF